MSKEDNEVSRAEPTQCGKSQRAPGAWGAAYRTNSLTHIRTASLARAIDSELFLKKIMTTSAIKSDTDTLAVRGQPHRIPTDESSSATYLRTQRDVTSLSS